MGKPRKIVYKWLIFHTYVSLQEGITITKFLIVLLILNCFIILLCCVGFAVLLSYFLAVFWIINSIVSTNHITFCVVDIVSLFMDCDIHIPHFFLAAIILKLIINQQTFCTEDYQQKMIIR